MCHTTVVNVLSCADRKADCVALLHFHGIKYDVSELSPVKCMQRHTTVSLVDGSACPAATSQSVAESDAESCALIILQYWLSQCCSCHHSGLVSYARVM